MKFYVLTRSFAAPIFSDTDEHYQEAETARAAIEAVRKRYSHPCGLYSAGAWSSHEAMHTGAPAEARWLCNHAREIERLTKDKSCYSLRGDGPGRFSVDYEAHFVANPKDGEFVA